MHAEHQVKGIASDLVAHYQAEARRKGGITFCSGTDDEDGRTSLANTDLYTDLFRHIAEITNLGRHLYEFYERQGYMIVGVIPDSNGSGKPNIIMAKRL